MPQTAAAQPGGFPQRTTTAQAHRRASLRAGDDDQANLTRARLITAFHEAAAQRVPKLSIVWICDRSGVARSTFYTHYATVDELAADAITESFAEVSAGDVELRVGALPEGERIPGSRIARIGLDQTLATFEGARATIDYAISIGSRPAITERLIERFAAYTRHTIAAEYTELSDDARALATDYVSAGTTHAILAWIFGPGDVSRDALLDQLVDLLPARLVAGE